jgi:phage I-like protein
MSTPQSLIQAALIRLQARLGSGLADSVAGLAALAQEAPERLRSEWELFWQEVEQEAERLENGEAASGSTPGPTGPSAAAGATAGTRQAQERIDALRATVAALSRRLEDRA